MGIIEGQQSCGDGKERNDRVVAIEQDNHSFADIQVIRDLGNQFVQELEQFFVNYHKLSGEKYEVFGVKGIRSAAKAIEKGRRAYRRETSHAKWCYFPFPIREVDSRTREENQARN